MTSREMKYIVENREMLERDYSGRYIAVHGERVVAAGRTIHEVYAQLETSTISNPLVTYVPRENEVLLV